MFQFKRISYLLATLVALLIAMQNSNVNAFHMQPTTNSLCQVMINGVEVSMATIDRPNGYFISSIVDNNIKYLLNICNASPKPYYWRESYCKFPKESSGYQFHLQIDRCYSLSTSENPTVSYNDESKTVTITHPPSLMNRDGVKRQMEVSLICDRNTDLLPELYFEGEQNRDGVIVDRFFGKSSYVCH